MAIDPATARIIAKIALSAANDEESRKKLLIAALIPVVAVLLIICLFVYILTSPLSFMLNFFINDDDRAAVEEYKIQYSNLVKLQKGTLIFNGKYPMPAKGEIVSPYGMRLHTVTGENVMHTGIDIGTAWHCPVMSVADGQVVKIGISESYGYYIIIRHELMEETFYSLYAHLSTIYALPDHEIEQGDIIGLEGGEPGEDIYPGVSTGHHLHFEIRTGMELSTHVDPVPYLYTLRKDEEETGNAFIPFK